MQTAVKLRYEHTSRDWHDVPAFARGAATRPSRTWCSASIGNPVLLAVSTSIRREKLKSNVYSGYTANVFGVAVNSYF